MADYNGWTNKQTWTVNLWIDNDGYAGGSDAVAERAAEIVADDGRDDAVRTLAAEIRAQIEEQVDEETGGARGLSGDLLGHALALVDWEEIAQHYVDEVEVDDDEEGSHE